MFKPVDVLSKVIVTELTLTEILDSKERYPKDKVRDLDRKPAKVLKFSGVSIGHNILDIYSGGGWYSELFSKAVGKNGNVFAHNDELTWRFGGNEMKKRTSNNRLENIIRIDQVPIADINLPAKSIDIAFMAINYHDLFFTSRIKNGEKELMRNEVVDYQKAFTNVKRLLKDNGVLIVTDHIAQKGSGYQAANELHRIDPNIVIHQLNQVGFQLVEEAFYLRNPKDELNLLVFDEKIRGKTSRFIYKFAKPSNRHGI